jgi:hypothetical protein
METARQELRQELGQAFSYDQNRGLTIPPDGLAQQLTADAPALITKLAFSAC